MQKIKSALTRMGENDKFTSFLCYLLPFLGVGGYFLKLLVENAMTAVNGYYLIHYLYTYDHGFVARGLVGEVISWFHETVTDDVTQGAVILFSFLLMLSSVLCIGKALSKVKNKPRAFLAVFLISFVICVLPGSFRAYYIDFKLDKLFWAITLFSVLLINKKYAVWFVPALCLIATLVNPIYLFCSMILTAILLLQRFYDTKYSVKMGIICGFSYVSMIVLGIYALASEKYLGFETPQELVDFYFARYAGTLDETTYHLFVTEWLFDYFDTMDVIIRKSFEIYFVQWENWRICLGDLIFLMIPTYTAMGIFWKKCMDASEDILQKIIFFLCLISPVVIILPIAFSWESSKYYYNHLIVILSLVIYYIATGNEPVMSVVNKVFDRAKKHILLSLCAMFYVAIFIIE